MAIMSGGELILSDANSPWLYRTNYLAPGGLNLTRLFAAYGEIYKHQLWVYVLVRKRALATRRLPLKVYERTDSGRNDARDTPYAQLLRSPNPKHPAEFLWEWTSSTFDIYGEAIWLKVRGRDRTPAEVWPVHPTNVSILKADADDAQRYSVPKGSLIYLYGPGVLTGSDPQFAIPEADVVHFKSYNPQTTVRGLSPLEPLRATLVNEDAARRANAAFWANGARPSVALSHPKTLTQPVIDRLRAQWDEVHSGVDNFGKAAVLEEGMKPEILPLNNEEAQYIESRRLNREEACAAYDTPPPVVHILDRATFSNITEQMRSMYRDTMAPHLGGLEATLDFELRPDFDPEGRLYGEFLMDEVLRGAFETRTDAYQKGVNSGWLTPAEVREMENLPFLEGSDRLFVNSTLIPIDEASRHTAPVEPAPNEPTTKPAQAKSLDALWGRLGSYTSLDEIEPGVLVAGLNGEADLVRAVLEESRLNDESITEFRARLRAALA